MDNDKLREIAQDLRKDYEAAEKCLWNHLRNGRFKKKKFLRQYPIKIDIEGNVRFFTADFFCEESKLVIKIDCGDHENRKDFDSDKSYLINRLCVEVVCYDHEAVLNRIDEVLAHLKRML